MLVAEAVDGLAAKCGSGGRLPFSSAFPTHRKSGTRFPPMDGKRPRRYQLSSYEPSEPPAGKSRRISARMRRKRPLPGTYRSEHSSRPPTPRLPAPLCDDASGVDSTFTRSGRGGLDVEPGRTSRAVTQLVRCSTAPGAVSPTPAMAIQAIRPWSLRRTGPARGPIPLRHLLRSNPRGARNPNEQEATGHKPIAQPVSSCVRARGRNSGADLLAACSQQVADIRQPFSCRRP